VSSAATRSTKTRKVEKKGEWASKVWKKTPGKGSSDKYPKGNRVIGTENKRTNPGERTDRL